MKYRVTINNYYTVLQKSGEITSVVLRHFSDKDIADKFAAIHVDDFTSTTVSEVSDSDAVDKIIYP